MQSLSERVYHGRKRLRRSPFLSLKKSYLFCEFYLTVQTLTTFIFTTEFAQHIKDTNASSLHFLSVRPHHLLDILSVSNQSVCWCMGADLWGNHFTLTGEESKMSLSRFSLSHAIIFSTTSVGCMALKS